MYQLVFYVPASHVDEVKQAVFRQGAGRYGKYDYCCWQTLGQGQFRPLEGSTPYLGTGNQIATVSEYRVEMICQDEHIAQVVQALVAAHPYEEPAYSVIKLESIFLRDPRDAY